MFGIGANDRMNDPKNFCGRGVFVSIQTKKCGFDQKPFPIDNYQKSNAVRAIATYERRNTIVAIGRS